MMLEWIVSSCMVILAVLALRAGLGRRISTGLRYGLWALVLIRLLVPVQLFTSPVAGLQVNYRAPEVLREESLYVLPVHSEPAFDAGGTGEERGVPAAGSGSFGYARLEDGGKTLRRYAARLSPLQALQWIWLAGALVMGGVLLVSNLRFAARLRRVRKPLQGAAGPIPVYMAEGLPSPCLLGLFHTAVYLTPQAAADPAMLRHVKAHELTHYRHLDHLWSVLRGAALAVHWWNPLVWLAAACSQKDAELFCDEGALRQLGDGERRAYGETLLALVTAKTGPRDLLRCATTMSGGKRSLQERIRRIAHGQRVLVSATVAVVLLLCLIVACAFGRNGEADGTPSSDMGPATDALPYTPDLNRDGIQEQIRRHLINGDDQPREFRLAVAQAEMEDWLWSDTMDETHGGCDTYFLYQEDGLDYLLEYMPKMQQGECTYSYRLFHLQGGEEVTDRERSIEFDINFDAPSHRFDPEEIAAFLWEINGLIGESKLLVNTNTWMLNLEEDENGRLRDNILVSLNCPGSREFSSEDGLRASLETYAAYAKDHPDDTNSPLGDLLAEMAASKIGGISGQNEVTAEDLAALLRDAERDSRFHTYDSFAEEAAWMWSTAEWAVPISDGGTLYLLACDSGRVELSYETETEATSAFYESEALYDLVLKVGEPYYLEELPSANLDHDRSGPDKLVLRSDRPNGGTSWCLQCCPSSGGVWRGEANTAHPGWTSFYLCGTEDGDCLLQYTAYTGMGSGSYSYKLFYLGESATEVIVQENELFFNLNFDMAGDQDFDPKAIAAFMDEINALLEKSTLLLNTDPNLAAVFEREGRLYDSLSWLDGTREEDKSLLENLLDYRNQALAEAAVPSVEEVLSGLQEEDIRFMAFGGADLSVRRKKSVVADALNGIAEGADYRDGAGEEFNLNYATIGYIRDGEEDRHTILLEIGETGNLVRITCEGEVTAPFYSENPDNDGFYLRDVPYSVTAYVEDENLYRMVYGNDSLWGLDGSDETTGQLDGSLLENLLENLEASDLGNHIGKLEIDVPTFVAYLKAAERESDFSTWESETAAYLGSGASDEAYTILYAPMTDGSALWLYTREDSPSVLIILEVTGGAVSAFYDAPALQAYIQSFYYNE